MKDYEAIDLSSLCNAGFEILGGNLKAPIGIQEFHGLPFQIGPSEADERRCFIAFDKNRSSASFAISLNQPAYCLIFAHRLLESKIMEGGPLGNRIADYTFSLESGEEFQVPIRERFEIATVPSAGGSPFAAVADQKDGLIDRYQGRWGDAGRRQTEAMRGGSRGYYLWVWRNPKPDLKIESVQITPQASRFIIAAITVGHLDEYPFVRTGKRDVKLTLLQDEEAQKPFDIEVEVDRGVATYPYALPNRSAEEFLSDSFKGWGEEQNPKSSPAYVEIAATPSATIRVKQGQDELGNVKWGDLEKKVVIDPTPRLRVELLDRGRNWVHTTVVDADTDKPVPCRIHFRSPDGVPYQPHAHHGHVNSNLGSWHMDVGGDVRLGQITYAYIDGSCQGWLPRGEVIVDVARGYEYEPIRTKVEIKPGQRELTLKLRRWCNMNADRWFSGDSHVHFLSTQGSHTEAQGEDLNVVNLLQSQWGHLFTNTEEFTGKPSVSADGSSIVYITQENRQHFLGHLILLGLKKPVMPWCTDGPGEAELGGTLEITMSDWADQCHSQGGTVIIPHLPSPNCEPATLIATGRVDGVEMLRHGTYNHMEYYRYLNCGYRLPLVGGTDKMSSDVPVGIYRTYVYIPPDEAFTYENWCKNLSLGRTFHSGGPILKFTVDGHRIGDTAQLPGNGGTVEVEAVAESILPIHTLEIVQQGRVVASTEEEKGSKKLRLKASLKVNRHTWLAARCSGPKYLQSIPHHDGWRRGIMAHTSPIYIACGGEWWLFDREVAQYMLTLIEGGLTYIRQVSPQYPKDITTHHHGEEDHMAYLERPFLEAKEAIHRTMHKLGIPH